MAYSFDELIDRRNTNSMKWDFAAERGFPTDAYPLWVADMDFLAPPAVREAVHAVAEHGIFGYTDMKPDYFDAACKWFTSRHGFTPKREWFMYTPGVVFALAAAINAFTEKGDGILIQPPVYGPFTATVESNERKLIENQLVIRNGRYEMDYDDLDKKLAQSKIMILCSPHNPASRVWTPEELIKVGELCLKHNVIIVSDEIHCDFIFNGYKHHVFTTLDDRFMENTIVCTAPSKTFNIAGMQLSNIFVPNPELNKRMRIAIAATGYEHPTICGLAAAKAAYLHGEDWLDELMPYLEDNAKYCVSYIKERIPNVDVFEPEGTFLLWLDFRGLKLPHDEVSRLLLNKAKLWLDNGPKFGKGGECFMRLNIGCPRSVLEEVMSKLEAAVKSI